MSEETTAQSAEPDSPPHSPQGNPPSADGSARGAWAIRVTANPPAATKPTRSQRKKILVPVVLAVLGGAAVVAGFAVYPRRAIPPALATPAVQIDGSQIKGSSPYVNNHMDTIDYSVHQVRPDVAQVEISVAWAVPLSTAI